MKYQMRIITQLNYEQKEGFDLILAVYVCM